MPEALSVLFVFAICAFLFIAASLRNRNPSRVITHDDLQRLSQHETWLRERLQRAEQEQWGAEMIAGLADELRATSEQLARAAVPDSNR